MTTAHPRLLPVGTRMMSPGLSVSSEPTALARWSACRTRDCSASRSATRRDSLDFGTPRARLAAANPGNFSAAELAAIRAAYPRQAALQQLLAADRSFPSSALERIGLDIASTPEPVSQSFADFDADVDLATAAGDLLISAEELRQDLDLLDPVFSVLGGGGKLDRDDFNALYANAACILTVVLDNQVDPAFCDAVAALP